LALLEEAEMMLQVVVPLFWHSDLWAEIDMATFSNVKDCLLFAVPWLVQSAAVVPCSLTEQHLQQVVSGSKTLLQVKTDMSQSNVMLYTMQSLQALFRIEKENRLVLVNNWHSQKEDSFFNQCVRLEESPIQQTMQMYLDAI
jgi:hypothetical protein